MPGVGPRTAEKYAEAILNFSDRELEEFGNLIRAVKAGVVACSLCHRLGESGLDGNLCRLCRDDRRDRKQICVVEGNQEMAVIEKTGEYRGLYHILGGTISPLDGRGPEKIHLKELYLRVKNSHPKTEEVIIATSPTTEGDTTSLYIEQILKPLKIKITKLARGLATGVELEYADDLTVVSALKNRK